MNGIVVSVDRVSKKYQLGEGLPQRRTLRDAIASGIASKKSLVTKTKDILWALRDVSFQVRHGEVLGIIGRNGSGKSTLLKILSRITEPTSGSVAIHGRVNSLLDVGTGFHSELTGRENVYLSGAILGMSRAEIDRKFDEIVTFAEVEKFLDTPVKHYSSGMFVRLAFAVAVHMEPDILIVDEVLSVGDHSFQQKCLGKLGDVASQDRTVVFVSHHLPSVSRLCTRALLLNAGQVQMDGPPNQVIETYLLSHAHVTGVWSRPDHDSGDAKPIALLEARILKSSGDASAIVGFREGFQMEVNYEIRQHVSDWWVLFRVLDTAGQAVFTSWDIDGLPCEKEYSPGIYKTTCSIPGRLLKPNVYGVTLAAVTRHTMFESYENALRFEVSSQDYPLNEGRMGAVTPILKWRSEKMNRSRLT